MAQCRYEDFNGKCQFFTKNYALGGCDSEGICICLNDSYPGFTCESFEDASYICNICGGNSEGECEGCLEE